jgi:hypothetical protein
MSLDLRDVEPAGACVRATCKSALFGAGLEVWKEPDCIATTDCVNDAAAQA